MHMETIIQIIASLVSMAVYAAIIALIVLLCERRKLRSAKKTQTRTLENLEAANHSSFEANGVHPSVLALYRPVQEAKLQYAEIDEKYAFQHFKVFDRDDIYGDILWLRVPQKYEAKNLHSALSELLYDRSIGNEELKRLRQKFSGSRQMLYFRISDPSAAKQIDAVHRYKYRMYGFHLICDWEGHPYRYYDFIDDHFYFDDSTSIPHALDDSPSEMRVQTRVFSDEEREQELEEAIRAGFMTGDPHEIVEVPWGHTTRAMAEYLSSFSFVKENDSPSYLFWGIYRIRIARKGDLWCGDSADEKGNWGEGGFDSADINTAILGTLWMGMCPWSLSKRIAPRESAGVPVFEESYRLTLPMKREKLSEHVHCYIMHGEKGYDLYRASGRFDKAYRIRRNLSYEDAVKYWQSGEMVIHRTTAFLDCMQEKGVIPDDRCRAELDELMLWPSGWYSSSEAIEL